MRGGALQLSSGSYKKPISLMNLAVFVVVWLYNRANFDRMPEIVGRNTGCQA